MRLVLADIGFNLELIKREGAICLVRRWKTQHKSFHWEVIRMRWFEEAILPTGLIAPAGERYPASSKWGIDGFTYLQGDLEGAERRFKRMLEGTSVGSLS